MAHLRGSAEAAEQLRCHISSAVQELNAIVSAQSRRLETLSESCQDSSYDTMKYVLRQIITYLQAAMPDLAEVHNRLIAYRDLLESLDQPNAQTVSQGLAAKGYDQQIQAQWISSYQNATVKQSGKQWLDALSAEQREAIRSYTGMAYTEINAALRGLSAGFPTEYHKNCSSLIHSALMQTSLPCNCVVYRGMKSDALGKLAALSDDAMVGEIYTDNGFMSTSLTPEDAFGGSVRLEIEVPKGVRGAYIGYVSEQGHSESEVLFDHGQYMKISSVRRDHNGSRIIRARMMR